MKKEEDWYENLKLELIKLEIASFRFRQDLIYLIETNPTILSDINLDERMSYLINSEDSINQGMIDLKQEILELESSGWNFLKEDFIDEFTYLQNIFHLEVEYYHKIVEYLALVDDYSIEGDQITKILEQNEEISDFCYRRMKENNQDLKRLKRERRNDYFE